MGIATKHTSSYVTEKRTVSGFNGISLRGIGRVRLQQTGTESLEVRAPQRWMKRIETRVKNGTLVLGFKKRFFPFFFLPISKRGDIEFLITADVVEGLSISGAGSFETDRLRADDLRLSVSGAGKIASQGIDAKNFRMSISGNGKIQANRVNSQAIQIRGSGIAKIRLNDVTSETIHSSLSGAGEIEATGSVRDAEVRISGAGRLDMEDMEISRCKVHISGAGKVRVHVTDSLDVSISGSGRVRYKGDPQISARTSGSGSVLRIGEE